MISKPLPNRIPTSKLLAKLLPISVKVASKHTHAKYGLYTPKGLALAKARESLARTSALKILKGHLPRPLPLCGPISMWFETVWNYFVT